MFKIDNLFCDDKKLPALLRAMSGLVQSGFAVVPVVNVEKRGKKIVAASNGSTVEMFGDYLHKHKITEVNSEMGRDYCKQVGKDPEAYNYLFAKCKKAGLLRKVGKGYHSKWKVVK